MAKLKIYLDTSFISHLQQNDVPEKVAATQKIWNNIVAGKYEVFISDVVIKELLDADETRRDYMVSHLSDIDYHLIAVGDKEFAFAKKIIDAGVLRPKSYDDSQHIAAAVSAGCDVIVSWNFKHLANVKTNMGVRVITVAEGYKDIIICSPMALLEEEE